VPPSWRLDAAAGTSPASARPSCCTSSTRQQPPARSDASRARTSEDVPFDFTTILETAHPKSQIS
jgi:hypothetical protein